MVELTTMGIPAATDSGSPGTQPTQGDPASGLLALLREQGDALDTLRSRTEEAQQVSETGFLDRIKKNPVEAALQALLVGGATAVGGPLGALLATGGVTSANQAQRAQEKAEVTELESKVLEAAEKRRQTLANLITSGQGRGLLNPDGTFPAGTSAELLGNMLGLGIPFHPLSVYAVEQNATMIGAMAGLMEKLLPQVKGQKGRYEVFAALNSALPKSNQFTPDQLTLLAGAGETPLTYDQFISIYPTVEGVQAGIFADLHNLDYSDARVLELAGKPIGKVPTKPASDPLKEIAYRAYVKLRQSVAENPELMMAPASQLADMFLDPSTAEVLRDEVPGFKEGDDTGLLERVFASTIQTTLLADAIRTSRNPNAKTLGNPEVISDLVLKAFESLQSNLRIEQGFMMTEEMDRLVAAEQAQNPSLTRQEALNKIVLEKLALPGQE